MHPPLAFWDPELDCKVMKHRSRVESSLTESPVCHQLYLDLEEHCQGSPYVLCLGNPVPRRC